MSGRAWPAWMRATDIADLLRLSVPIAVSRMSMMLMSLTDAIVLGQNAPGELPYVLNSWLPIGISLGFGMGILLGVQVLTSECVGRGERQESARIFRRGFWFALSLGLLLTLIIYPLAGPLFRWLFADAAPVMEGADLAAPGAVAAETAKVTRILSLNMVGFMVTTVAAMYLEALRRPLLVTVTSYLGVLVNLVLDLALVAGWWGMPQMGAEGVAWATTGTRFALMAVFLVMIVAYTPALKPASPAPPGELRRQLSVGGGTAISNVVEWGGFNFTYVIATWISLSANVVYGYTTQVLGVCFMIYLGIGTATSVRVAEAFGRNDQDAVANAGRLGVVSTILAGALVGGLAFVLRDPIAAGLVDAEATMEGIAIAPAIAALMWMVAIATVFDGLQATASMALRAQNIVWLPSALHTASFFALMIPLGYWLGLVMGRGAQGMVEAAMWGCVAAGLAQTALLEWKTVRNRRLRTAS